jgi:hypothetical protein
LNRVRYIEGTQQRTAVARRLSEDFAEKVRNYFSTLKAGAFENTLAVVIRPQFTDVGGFESFTITLVVGDDERTAQAFGATIPNYVFMGDVRTWDYIHRAFQGLLWKAITTEVRF